MLLFLLKCEMRQVVKKRIPVGSVLHIIQAIICHELSNTWFACLCCQGLRPLFVARHNRVCTHNACCILL